MVVQCFDRGSRVDLERRSGLCARLCNLYQNASSWGANKPCKGRGQQGVGVFDVQETATSNRRVTPLSAGWFCVQSAKKAPEVSFAGVHAHFTIYNNHTGKIGISRGSVTFTRKTTVISRRVKQYWGTRGSRMEHRLRPWWFETA